MAAVSRCHLDVIYRRRELAHASGHLADVASAIYRHLTAWILTDTIELGRLIAVVAAVVDLIASEVVVDAEAVVAFVVRLTADPERLVGWKEWGGGRGRIRER